MRHARAALFVVALLASAPVMGGCASLGIGGGSAASVHMVATQAMIDCDSAYSAIAVIVSQIDVSGSPSIKSKADSIRSEAWAILQDARKVYATGTAPSSLTLVGLLTQAQSLQSGALQ